MEDLAISPGIQDPRLNTAECVIQGYQPNIDATGVNSYIRAILYCSLFSVLLIGPILGFFSLTFFGNDPNATEKDKFDNRDMMEHQNKDMMEHQHKDRHQRAYYVNMIAVAAVMRGFLNVIK